MSNNYTMLYCPPNVTVDQIWLAHGWSPCFLDTTSIALISAFLAIFGTAQLFIYQRHGSRNADVRPSGWYRAQLAAHIILPTLALLRFLLLTNGAFGAEPLLYGYQILHITLTLLSYTWLVLLLCLERSWLLPSTPTAGHGLVLLASWTMLFIVQNLQLVNMQSEEWVDMAGMKQRVEIAIFAGQYACALFVFVVGLKAPGIARVGSDGSDYDRLQPTTADSENRSTWSNAWVRTKTLFPYLWPKNSWLLQLRVLICIGLLIGGRVLNVYVPIYQKLIVDSLTGTEFRYDWILTYVLFKFLQGGGVGSMGFLNNLRSFLWIPVQQFTTREIQVELFRHLHQLSLRWHLQRKTGEVLRVMDRGTDSINTLLNYILFSITPTIVDILVAIVFFIGAFNWWFGLIVFVTMFAYVTITVLVTEWRTKFQRRMNLADNAQKARSVDSLLNFETVKYYGAEQYEVDAYRDVIVTYQAAEYQSILTLNILNSAQNAMITAGLMAGSLLCAYLVVEERVLTVGDYVLFASYIIQLYVPLNWFGTYYRAIQKNFVDMENMFELLREQQDVIDAPGAAALAASRGDVEFNNVSFGYQPERLVLRNVSFNVRSGRTVALVGPSGAGKSTIVRLLFRFYDVQSGAIVIDGQNIKTVTQDSLRRTIGVVPQDTVLFNNTIKFNIQYGRVEAPVADVIAAANNADIHEKILRFPDQYDTQVGERGLRLSGGEKQRVAIARTILKSPLIVLLDEATSALDTQTERNIQSALRKVCANRTTLIVAHRLSTIIHADEILVLKDGEIAERGSHQELLEMGDDGIYAGMWHQQLENLDVNGDEGESSTEPETNSVAAKAAAAPAGHHHHHHHH